MSNFGIDPQTAQMLQAAVGHVLSALTVYVTYKVGMKQAEQQGTQPPVIDVKQVESGEKALTVVKPAIERFGNEDEQTALTGFQQNPRMFRAVLEQALLELAQRQPAFAAELRQLVPQVQAGGTTGAVNISGGTVHGPVVGSNTGTISGTYTFGEQSDKPGNQ